MKFSSLSNKIKGNPTMTEGTVYSILVICGISHFHNDMIQSIIPSIYPILKDKFDFSFAQIGLNTLVFQMTSSILQPFTGLYADKHPQKAPELNTHISKRAKYGALAILILLVFSKYFYTSCITSYFTFFLIDKFGVSVKASQLFLFVFLAAFAIGTVAGGMLGDRFGRKYVIWFSILGAASFAIAMPYFKRTTRHPTTVMATRTDIPSTATAATPNT